MCVEKILAPVVTNTVQLSLIDTGLRFELKYYIHKLVLAVQLSCLCKVYGDYDTCTSRSELFSPRSLIKMYLLTTTETGT